MDTILLFIPDSLKRSSSFVYPIFGSFILSFTPLLILNEIFKFKKRKHIERLRSDSNQNDESSQDDDIDIQFPDYIMSPLVSFAAGAIFVEAFVHTLTEILSSRITTHEESTSSIIEHALTLVLHGILFVFSIERIVSAVGEAVTAHQKRKILKSLIKYKYKMEKHRRDKRKPYNTLDSSDLEGAALLDLDDETFRNLEDEAIEEDLDKALNSDSTTDDQSSPKMDNDFECEYSSRRTVGRNSGRTGSVDPNVSSTYKRTVKGKFFNEENGLSHKAQIKRRNTGSNQFHSQELLQAVGTFIHCLTDGITLTLAFKASFASGGAAWVALALHELPHKFGQYATYIKGGIDHYSSIKYLLIGSFGTISGAIGSFVLAEILGGDPNEVGNAEAFQNLQLYAAGGMLYLGCTGILAEFLHSSDDHDHDHKEPSATERAAEFKAEIKRLTETRNRSSTKEGTLLPVLKKHIYQLLPDILSSKSPYGIILNATMQIVFIFVGIKITSH